MRNTPHTPKPKVRDRISNAWTSLTLLSSLGVLAASLMFANGDGGGAGAGSGEGGAPPAPGGTGTPPAPAPTITTAEATRAAELAAANAKTAAEQAIADQLGVTIEEAKKIVADKKAADDATKSEAQKALEAAQTAQAAAEKAKADADRERLAAKVERKLAAAGIPEAAMTRASRLVAVPADADDAAIDVEITALKTEMPALFTTPGGAPPAPPAGTGTPPPAPPAGGQAITTALERGKALAQQRHPQPAA